MSPIECRNTESQRNAERLKIIAKSIGTYLGLLYFYCKESFTEEVQSRQ
jgi:hypothetical protein